ncbi:MAG: hypothetical protein WAW75_02950, partial [Gallionella sp.]
MPESSKVVVAAPVVVDIQKAEPAKAAATNAAGEPSMAEYAATREAELRGDKPAKPAVSTEAAPAAATDESAAATEKKADEGKTDEETDPLSQVDE